ncbi:MAG: pseudouridine synthase [Gracilibacter sp. BRH_c7a]|nr:MAG: pseudouridine synthase [Gracilibacter sp. BRH_c7a]
MSDSKEVLERLQKVISRKGIASRRQAEQLISQGMVKVNGITVTEQGIKVTPVDIIEVSGVKIQNSDVLTYVLLNKPKGVITSASDPQKRKTVIDLIKDQIDTRVYPVGRLDYDTSGLLILTNDGELTYRLTHPSYGVEKTYRVWIDGHISQESLDILRNGVYLEDGITSPASIMIDQVGKKGKELTRVEVTIHEGKNRQVRRMFAKVGHPVLELQRIAFGPLKLDEKLLPGTYRNLLKSEVIALKKEVGL